MKTKFIIYYPLFFLTLMGAFLTSCKKDEPQGETFKLPLVDYDFKGTVDEIIRFEEQNGNTYDASRSTTTSLIFTSTSKNFPERIYKLELGRIVEIYMPCSDGSYLEGIVPQIESELKAQKWQTWEGPVNNGVCDVAFQLLREVNGQNMQIGAAAINIKADIAQKKVPGILFIFTRTRGDLDINTAKLPEIYLDAIGKLRPEVESYLKNKGANIDKTSSFIYEIVDNPALMDGRIGYFFPGADDDPCAQIIISTASFRFNKTENVANQLKELGFSKDKEDENTIYFYNETKDLWAVVRTYPSSQLSTPNILFTRKIS